MDDYLIGKKTASEIWPVRVCESETNGVQKFARSSDARISSVAIRVRGREWERQTADLVKSFLKKCYSDAARAAQR